MNKMEGTVLSVGNLRNEFKIVIRSCYCECACVSTNCSQSIFDVRRQYQGRQMANFRWKVILSRVTINACNV